MHDYFAQTNYVCGLYNMIQHKIKTSPEETSDYEDAFLENFQLYLAKALKQDYAGGWEKELLKLSDEIKKVAQANKGSE